MTAEDTTNTPATDKVAVWPPVPRPKKGDIVLFRVWVYPTGNYRNSYPNIVPATVRTVHRDGTFTIEYRDGTDDSAPIRFKKERIGCGEIVPDRVKVKVETTWGREWNGSYNALTPGRGAYVTVMEASGALADRGPGFRGCPCGSGTSEAEALRDFAFRGRYEYLGVKTLTHDMLDVVERRDYRKTESEEN